MLYREGYYNPVVDDPDLTDVFIRKNRNGPTGRIELDFDAEHTRFTSRVKKRTTAPRTVSETVAAF